MGEMQQTGHADPPGTEACTMQLLSLHTLRGLIGLHPPYVVPPHQRARRCSCRCGL